MNLLDLKSFEPLIGYAFQTGKLGQVLGDVGVLVRDYSITGGKMDVDAVDKAGEIDPTLTAFGDVIRLVGEMSKDPKHHTDALDVLRALTGTSK